MDQFIGSDLLRFPAETAGELGGRVGKLPLEECQSDNGCVSSLVINSTYTHMVAFHTAVQDSGHGDPT